MIPVKNCTILGAIIFAAAQLDEHSTIPLFTGLSVCGTLIAAAYWIGRKQQAFTDEQKELKREFQAMRTERSFDMSVLRNDIGRAVKDDSMCSTGTFRILVVEDELHDRMILRKKLCPMFTIVEADTITKANSLMANERFDCVLLDLKLPDANIDTVAREFMEDNPGTLCIALTGNDHPGLREQCLAAGLDDVWIKGKDDVDLSTVSKRIRTAIQRRKHFGKQKHL